MADSHHESDLHAEDQAADAHAGTVETVAAGHGDGHGDHAESGPIQVDLGMFLMFLLVFVLAAAVLKKYAWGPILDGLDEREEKIARSIQQAKEIQARMEEVESRQSVMIAEADEKAKAIVELSREGAKETARAIEKKASEEARILVENAAREIDAATKKAKASLRQESAELAVSLAAKILETEMTAEQQSGLTDKLIKEI